MRAKIVAFCERRSESELCHIYHVLVNFEGQVSVIKDIIYVVVSLEGR